MKKNTLGDVSRTKFYTVWRNMKRRCNDPKNKSYKYYGGRGILVCDRWLNYENFEDDMYDEYGYYIESTLERRNTSCTLDRIDNSSNYCKENCRWVSQKVQCNNKRQRIRRQTIKERKEKWNIYMKNYQRKHAKIKKLAIIA